jgi:hypothetical protein
MKRACSSLCFVSNAEQRDGSARSAVAQYAQLDTVSRLLKWATATQYDVPTLYPEHDLSLMLGFHAASSPVVMLYNAAKSRQLLILGNAMPVIEQLAAMPVALRCVPATARRTAPYPASRMPRTCRQWR